MPPECARDHVRLVMDHSEFEVGDEPAGRQVGRCPPRPRQARSNRRHRSGCRGRTPFRAGSAARSGAPQRPPMQRTRSHAQAQPGATPGTPRKSRSRRSAPTDCRNRSRTMFGAGEPLNRSFSGSRADEELDRLLLFLSRPRKRVQPVEPDVARSNAEWALVVVRPANPELHGGVRTRRCR